MLFRAIAVVVFSASVFAAVEGDAVYAQRCAACHNTTTARVPPKDALQGLSTTRILRTLDFGTMLSIGSQLTREE